MPSNFKNFKPHYSSVFNKVLNDLNCAYHENCLMSLYLHQSCITGLPKKNDNVFSKLIKIDDSIFKISLLS